MGQISEKYAALVQSSALERDAAQLEAVDRLERLEAALAGAHAKRRSVWRFFKRKQTSQRGLYLYGGVGRGKSMLMDFFFEKAVFESKRRVHFHEFMAEVHDRIRTWRAADAGDPIPKTAHDIATEAGLLCFDELHVTDIADALILGRLFERLFEQGVTVVATSNAAPEELYKNGLNRQLFLPFIELIKMNMDVFELKSAKDFRLEKIAGETLYFCPLGEGSERALDRHWARLTGNLAGRPLTLDVGGRPLTVPQASMGIARFTFEDLCAKPLGANDYLHIAHAFHTVLIDGIPVLDASRRNEARRFITLIDTLYDNQTGLIVSAAGEPDALYQKGDGADLFARTASRLVEMRSEAYLAARSKARHGR